MRRTSQKNRCAKISLDKNQQICRCHDKLMEAYARQLNTDENVSEFSMNIPLDFKKTALPSDLPAPPTSHMSDFLIKKTDGTMAVRECVFRHILPRQSVIDLLQLSLEYWYQQGVTDWGIVIEKEA
ncbi:hypothetical protein LJC60_00590 [Ruminococcaceae bacterium OttesenSCG-928-D13]|nr:hypothetical protein [Ruminococcaceae bacterium OttesenSCG-928-D13]